MTVEVAFAPRGCEGLLASLHARCFSGEIWDAPAMAALLAMPGAFALVARAGDQPRGFLLARFAGDEGEIISIAVLPDCRGQGIGRLLVRHLVDRAAGVAQVLFLEVAADNGPALALYGGCGFVEVGRRRRYYADGRDALVMRLNLPARCTK